MVKIDLGTIENSGADAHTTSASQIELLFEVLALPHDSLTVDEKYRVSVGMLHSQQQYVTVAQDDQTYENYATPSVRQRHSTPSGILCCTDPG